MAARRIAGSSINWGKMAEKVGTSQKPMFNAFKVKSDSYLRKVLANPEKPPAIDWATYKAKIAIPGLVDAFQKEYESLQIAYPADKVTPLVDAQQAEAETKIASFVADCNARIAAHEAEYNKWASVIPFEQMTLEEYATSFPDQAWKEKEPTFWPHDEKDTGAAPAHAGH